MPQLLQFDVMRRVLDRMIGRPETTTSSFPPEPAPAELSQDRVPCVPICRVSPAGIQLIQRFEGCARLRPDRLYEAYPDPGTGGAPWTIGWGSTGNDIGPETVWTKEQCDARFAHDVERHATEVAATLADSPVSQQQFDALVSFHFNTGAIARSTLAKLHCKADYEGAAREFARWKFAGGRVLKGLVRRRREEAQLYRSASANV